MTHSPKKRAYDEAIAIIEARLPLYNDIGQQNALRECISSIRGAAERTQTITRPYPDLLTEEEGKELLSAAENLWKDLQENKLGGYSGGNRPFWILGFFKHVIEKFGRRDVGLTWSKDDLDAAASTLERARGAE